MTTNISEFIPGFGGVRVFYVMCYRSLFLLLSFFFGTLCCLSFFDMASDRLFDILIFLLHE
jgi:hypothetical protein